MRSFCKQKGSASIGNGCETTTAGVMYCFSNQKKSRWKNYKRTEMNYEEQGGTRNPNADLMFEKKRTYSCRFTAESRRLSLDQLRLMQRPRLRKTRGATAAAELGL